MTLPGEREVTRSPRWGFWMVVKVNEADGSVWEKKGKAPLRNEDKIVELKASVI